MSGPAGTADNLKNALRRVVKKAVGINLRISGFGPHDAPLSMRVNIFDSSGKQVATDATIKSDNFDLGPGEEKSLEMVCAESRIGVLVKNSAGSPVLGYVRIVDLQKDSYAEQDNSANKMKYFKVPPGTYKVDVECPGSDATRVRSEPFQLEAGGEVIREMICP